MSTDQENQQESLTNPSEKTQHPFDRLMFGSRAPAPPPKQDKPQEDSNLLNQVNLEELMMQVGTLMESTKQLKPMFNKIRPFIDQWLKK